MAEAPRRLERHLGDRNMSQWVSDGITITGMIAIIGFLWAMRSDMHREISGLRTEMHHQIAELRERMARLEGLFEGFTKSKEPS